MLFVGLGVDFGIQYSVRYRAERHEHRLYSDPALEKAAEYSAVPLTRLRRYYGYGKFPLVSAD